MKEILDPRVVKTENGYQATCKCGSSHKYPQKVTALRMVNRGTCKSCKKDYRLADTHSLDIYKNKEEKWCSTCPKCGIEQPYTRKEHARNSALKKQHCKKCASTLNKFNKSNSVGFKTRLFNKFSKSAAARNLLWLLTEKEMFSNYNGKCALTGWDISTDYKNCTASLDRIDSKDSYNADNIQWVHTMVNMCKNKYDQEEFINMCKAITDKAKW
jgi:RNase P subunit RPR2